jgi:hypothetical protein
MGGAPECTSVSTTLQPRSNTFGGLADACPAAIKVTASGPFNRSSSPGRAEHQLSLNQGALLRHCRRLYIPHLELRYRFIGQKLAQVDCRLTKIHATFGLTRSY